MNGTSFPRKLLEQSKEERFAYFEEFIISHPVVDKVLAKIIKAITLSKSGQIILVFGPTGVGKTTLIQLLNKKIIEKYIDDLRSDLNFIPIISVEAPMPTIGNFSWVDLFSDMLEQLNGSSKESPFFKDLRYQVNKERKDFFEKFNYNRTSRLRFVVEKSLIARGSKVVSIDEAQHIAVLGSARKLLDQPNTIKSIANRTKTVNILFGNYDLLLFRNLNGQLSRRTEDIHFCRYDSGIKEDIELFQNIIWTFQNHLPVKKSPNLLAAWEYLYERSLGCVGILKEWLDRAFKLMLDDNVEELTVEHLEATALPESKCITIAREIFAAEDELSETVGGEYSLKQLLDEQTKKGLKKENEQDEESTKKESVRRKNLVGVRKPHRDKIGGPENETRQRN